MSSNAFGKPAMAPPTKGVHTEAALPADHLSGPSSSSGGAALTASSPSAAAETTPPLRVAKALKREAESLWDVPPESYGARGCSQFLSVTAQLVSVAVLGSFQFGYNLAALNTSKAFVSLDFGWCRDTFTGLTYVGCEKGLVYGSLVTTAVFAGAALGCILGGHVTDYGRRAALLGTHCLCCVGCGLSAGAEGFVSLLLARLVVGVSVGLFTVCVPMYIAEVSPDSRRGFFGTFHQLFITIGIFCGTIGGLAFGAAPAVNQRIQVSTFQSGWWRALLGIPMIVSVGAIVLYTWVYAFETPHYMVEKKQRAKAAALLREIYNRSDVETEMMRLLRGQYEKKIQRAQQLSVWRALFQPHSAYRHVIVLACLLSIFQQFSGINVLVANSNNLYASLKLPGSAITGLSVGFAGLNVVLTIVTVPLVDRLGRRTLLLFSLVTQAAAMLVAFLANVVDESNVAVKWVTVACVYVFIVGFAVGYGPVLWLYLHEIFPAEIKQSATGLASALNWVATIAIVLPSDFLLQSSFTIFVGLCTAALIFILIVTLIFVKETKGLSLEESPYFRGRHRAISGSAYDVCLTTGGVQRESSSRADALPPGRGGVTTTVLRGSMAGAGGLTVAVPGGVPAASGAVDGAALGKSVSTQGGAQSDIQGGVEISQHKAVPHLQRFSIAGTTMAGSANSSAGNGELAGQAAFRGRTSEEVLKVV